MAGSEEQKTPKEEFVPVNFRMPKSLKIRLLRIAERNDRDVTKEATRALATHANKQERILKLSPIS